MLQYVYRIKTMYNFINKYKTEMIIIFILIIILIIYLLFFGEKNKIINNHNTITSVPLLNYIKENFYYISQNPTTRPIIDCVGSFANGICLPSNDLNLNCGPGTQTQKYEISQEAANGGAQCTYTQGQEQIVPCNLAPCPIDSKYIPTDKILNFY
jgi:hypothetical protein